MEARQNNTVGKKKRGDSLSALKSFYSNSKYRSDRSSRKLSDVTNSYEHKFSEDDDNDARVSERGGAAKSENSGFYTARGGYVSGKYSLVTPRSNTAESKYDDRDENYKSNDKHSIHAAPKKSRTRRDSRYNEVPNTARDGLGVGSARSICNALNARGPRLEAIGDSEEDDTCF